MGAGAAPLVQPVRLVGGADVRRVRRVGLRRHGNRRSRNPGTSVAYARALVRLVEAGPPHTCVRFSARGPSLLTRVRRLLQPLPGVRPAADTAVIPALLIALPWRSTWFVPSRSQAVSGGRS